MRRLHVFLLQSLIAVPGCLLLFAQCRTVPEDSVRPVPTLTRGDRLGDPVVESTPESISLIKVNNSYDDLLASPRYASLRRPTTLTGYGQLGVVETIKTDGLSKHEFRWVSTRRKNVMVAIFKNVVLVDSKSNQISNKSDLIWMWTPPKGTVDPGRITYGEGQSVSLDQNNQFTFGPPRTNILDDVFQTRVWCILAWDDQGIRITNASRELLFVLGG